MIDFDCLNYKINECEKSDLLSFFKKIDECCCIRQKEKIKFDFLLAIEYYINNGLSLEESLKLLDLKYLGKFYSDLSIHKYKIDDSAKILSLTTSYNFTTMFRLSVYLKEDIVPELLQMALNFTIKRFPTFATRLKKGFFWHYFETSKKRYFIEEEMDMPCTPFDFNNNDSQIFRVLYYKNRISIEIFHVLTDGSGAIIFLKSLLAEYLRLIGKKIALDETIIDINSEVESDELEDAFKKVPSLKCDYSMLFSKRVFQTKEKLSKIRPNRIIHFKLNSEKLKLVSKKYNVTVTEYFLTIMFYAAKLINKNSKYDYSILVPVNIRNYIPSKTIHNFTLPFFLKMQLKDDLDLLSIFKIVKEQSKTLKNKNSIVENFSIMKKMVNFLDCIPLNMKRPGSKLIYKFITKRSISNVLSNLGIVEFPKSISEHIESMDVFINASLSNSHLCTMITVNNLTTFSVTKLTSDLQFEEKMYELLSNDGLIPTVEGSEIYED